MLLRGKSKMQGGVFLPDTTKKSRNFFSASPSAECDYSHRRDVSATDTRQHARIFVTRDWAKIGCAMHGTPDGS